MKKIICFLMVSMFFQNIVLGQKDNETSLKYRRSTLHTILMESEHFLYKDTVIKAYNEAPFPDKYNEHRILEKSFNPLNFPVTDADRLADSLSQTKAGKFVKNLLSTATSGIIDSELKDYPITIRKYFEATGMAKELVAKWFNRQPDGTFDMNLIGERGFYDANQMQANIAKGAARGDALLADAGEELIKNTFVVVSKMNFVSNEKVAAAVRAIAILKANEISSELLRETAIKSAEKMYEQTKDGYSVWTTSFLYQLEWNDSIAAIFYQDFWMDKSNIDANKKQAFDNSDLFQLKLLGSEKATSLVLFSGEGKNTPDEIIKVATIRNIERVYAKLQKNYDVFKTKTPIWSIDPITAKIGKKEGLEGGEKFEILEQVIDSKTGLTKYVSKGKITVDKDQIWDNRFNLDGKIIELPDEDQNATNNVEATVFKGSSKNLYTGMLIKQVK